MPVHLKLNKLGILVVLLLVSFVTATAQGKVDDAIREGKAAFAAGDFPKACEWFARAVSIEPDRETAYRYWGDSLMKQGKATEAGDKFVEAYIAEPYSRLARVAFVSWAEKVHIKLAHPSVDIPTNINRKDKDTTITLDANMLSGGKNDNGAAAAWMMYGIIRAGWQSEFAKEYPDEKTYRHSLKEEVAALRGALEAVKKRDKNLDPSLQVLRKLEKEGLLESFVLLALPDEGIAKDFVPYRKSNIENLRRYVKQYVLTGGGQ
jgi:tetratricopeptide (TPR) repeat protein